MVDAILLWLPPVQRVSQAWLWDLVVETTVQTAVYRSCCIHRVDDQSGNNDSGNAQIPQFRKIASRARAGGCPDEGAEHCKNSPGCLNLLIYLIQKNRPRIDRCSSGNRSTLLVVDPVKARDPVSAYRTMSGYKLHVEVKETRRNEARQLNRPRD